MISTRTKTILIIILCFGILLRFTDHTDADIFAQRIVRSNRFSATTLSFSERNTANNTYISQLFITNGLQPQGFDLEAVRIKKDGKLNFKYRVKVIKVNGDDNFCSNLNLEVMREGIFKYKGKLMDFILDDNINNEIPQDWIFFVGLENNDAVLQNNICEFNFYFRTWRVNPDEKGGFFSERLLSNSIIAGNWQQ